MQFNQNRIDLYNIDELARVAPHMRRVYNVSPELDNNMRFILPAIATEIQNRARQGHPVREFAHMVLSFNSFDNADFDFLGYATTVRVHLGMLNREWPNLNVALQDTIPRACKAIAGAIAFSDPTFMRDQVGNDQVLINSIQEDNLTWQRLASMTNNANMYEPFVKNTFGAPPRSMVENNSFETNNVGSFADAFVTNANGASSGMGSTVAQYSDMPPTRYERIAMAERARQEQEALALQEQSKTSGARSMRNRVYSAQVEQQAPVAQPIAATHSAYAQQETATTGYIARAPQSSYAPAQAPAQAQASEPLAVMSINGHKVNIVRVVKDGCVYWKPSILQPYRPAYSKRTHRLNYVETDTGIILAVLAELNDESKEENMNYDAHAIDPTLGKPITNSPLRAPTPEAKILYSPEGSKMADNTVIEKDVTMVDSEESAIKAAIFMARQVPEPTPVITSRLVMTPVILPSAEDMEATAKLLVEISEAPSIAVAGELVMKINDPYLRTLVNEGINKDITAFLVRDLGMKGASVTDSMDTYSAELEQALGQSETVGEAFKELAPRVIPEILRVNTKFERAVSFPLMVPTSSSEDEASEQVVNRTLLLQRNLNLVTVPFTKNDMALNVGKDEAMALNAKSYPVLHTVLSNLLGSNVKLGQWMQPTNLLVSADGFIWEVAVGKLSNTALLVTER